MALVKTASDWIAVENGLEQIEMAATVSNQTVARMASEQIALVTVAGNLIAV